MGGGNDRVEARCCTSRYMVARGGFDNQAVLRLEVLLCSLLRLAGCSHVDPELYAEDLLIGIAADHVEHENIGSSLGASSLLDPYQVEVGVVKGES